MPGVAVLVSRCRVLTSVEMGLVAAEVWETVPAVWEGGRYWAVDGEAWGSRVVQGKVVVAAVVVVVVAVAVVVGGVEGSAEVPGWYGVVVEPGIVAEALVVVWKVSPSANWVLPVEVVRVVARTSVVIAGRSVSGVKGNTVEGL